MCIIPCAIGEEVTKPFDEAVAAYVLGPSSWNTPIPDRNLIMRAISYECLFHFIRRLTYLLAMDQDGSPYQQLARPS
jgi:hypothetical protein